MSILDEPNGTPGREEGDELAGSSSRTELEQRVRDLERENATLKADLTALHARHDVDRDLLVSFIVSDLPQNEQEYREWVANSHSLSDLLREMEMKFGLESPR